MYVNKIKLMMLSLRYLHKSKSSRFLNKQATLSPELKLLEMSNREQIVSYTHALWLSNLFLPSQKNSLQSTLGLHSHLCWMQSEWKPSSKKTPKHWNYPQKKTQEKTAWRGRWTRKRGPKPLEKPWRVANVQSRNKVRMHLLIPRERNNSL